MYTFRANYGRNNERLYMLASMAAMLGGFSSGGGPLPAFELPSIERPELKGLTGDDKIEAARERISNETIAKAEQRQLRRIARKQADRDRNFHPYPCTCTVEDKR